MCPFEYKYICHVFVFISTSSTPCNICVLLPLIPLPTSTGILLHPPRSSSNLRADGSSPKPTLFERYLHRPLGPVFDDLDVVSYNAIFNSTNNPPNYAEELWPETTWDEPVHHQDVHRRRPTPTPSKIFYLQAPRPSDGDIWYLWLLLKHGSTPRSFAAARTIDGVEHATFKNAAVAAQLLSDPLVNETSLAIKEAIENYATPSQLRNLLLLLMASDFPVGVAFDTYHTNMIDDRWKRSNAGPGAERLELLRALQVRLAAISSKQLSDFGIDVPDGFRHEDTELQRARAVQFHEKQRERDTSIVKDALDQFTTEQRDIYEEILAAIIADKPVVFDIRGRAGSGKTLLLNAIAAKARTLGKLVAPSAATGLAALNQPFGLTFHRTWAVPVPDIRDDRILQSNLIGSKRETVMSKVKLCTVDEAPSLHIAAFEAAARITPTPDPNTNNALTERPPVCEDPAPDIFDNFDYDLNVNGCHGPIPYDPDDDSCYPSQGK